MAETSIGKACAFIHGLLVTVTARREHQGENARPSAMMKSHPVLLPTETRQFTGLGAAP